MERYSLLYATSERGEYGVQASSPKLPDFLRRLGAADLNYTIEKVQQYLRGFSKMPGYEEEPSFEKPVAVRYAPMHLYKLDDMPKTMEPFCALCISGMEQKEGRETEYAQTLFFSREDMHTANYLDFLFGEYERNGKWLDFKQVENHRMGVKKLNPDQSVIQVEVNEMPDEKTALFCADAIINGKGVIIKIEDGTSFNHRAEQLLKQIYSLLPPRLATETGFSAYQQPANIPDMMQTTSMRIFVVPAKVPLANLPENISVVDLSSGTAPALSPTPVLKMLDLWHRLPWGKRKAAMEVVFRDAATNYQDPDEFVKRSEAFFEKLAGFEEWRKTPLTDITSVEELAAAYENAAAFNVIPWAEERIKAQLLAAIKGKKPGVLSADKLVECFFSNNGDSESLMKQWQFSNTICGTDSRYLTKTVAAEQKRIDDQVLAKETEQIKESFSKENEEIKAKLSSAQSDLSAARKDLEQERSQNRNAKQALQEAKHRETVAIASQKQAEEELRVAKKKLASLKAGTLDYSDEPRHGGGHRRKRRGTWIVPLVAFLLGALLCGAAWFATSLLKQKPEEEPIVETPAPVVEVLEPTPVEPEETTVEPEEQPITFDDWQNEETVKQLQKEVPEIKTVLTEDLAAYVPEELRDSWDALAVFSTEEALPENTDSDKSPDETSDEKTEGKKVAQYAVLLRAQENTKTDDLETNSFDTEGVFLRDDLLMIAFGETEMQKAAQKAFDLIAPQQEKQEPSEENEKAESDSSNENVDTSSTGNAVAFHPAANNADENAR